MFIQTTSLVLAMTIHFKILYFKWSIYNVQAKSHTQKHHGARKITKQCALIKTN